MDVVLTSSDVQNIVDIFSRLYSQEEVFAIGRLIGIDKNRYYGFGMNMVQLAEAFVNCIFREEKINDLLELVNKEKRYYRTEFANYALAKENAIIQKKLYENFKAVLIGVNEYNIGEGCNNLKYAASDASEMSIFFKNKWGIESKDIREFIQSVNYQDAIQGIKELCDSLNKNDNFLFFFSGHGIESKGHSYLALTDTEFDEKGNVKNAISLEELNLIIKDCNANLKVRFFDACHCGESFCKEIEEYKKVTYSMSKLMKKELLAQGSGWITFCSCNINEYSREDPCVNHGVFTYCLLQGLNGAARRGTGNMYIEDLKIYVCENVPKMVNDSVNPQNPQYQCEVEGNILIL